MCDCCTSDSMCKPLNLWRQAACANLWTSIVLCNQPMRTVALILTALANVTEAVVYSGPGRWVHIAACWAWKWCQEQHGRTENAKSMQPACRQNHKPWRQVHATPVPHFNRVSHGDATITSCFGQTLLHYLMFRFPGNGTTCCIICKQKAKLMTCRARHNKTVAGQLQIFERHCAAAEYNSPLWKPVP